MDLLTQKEATVLGYIARHASGSQRDIAKTTGISLGLINIILKRFIRAGYVRVSPVNKKRLDYELTSEGVAEAAKRSSAFAANTIGNFKLLNRNLSNLIEELYKSGNRYFSIHGDGELRGFVESVFQKYLTQSDIVLGTEHRDEAGCVVLNVTAAQHVLRPFDHGKIVEICARLGVGL